MSNEKKERIFFIGRFKPFSKKEESKEIEGIAELHNLAMQYGFLILRPDWIEGKPDFRIEAPTLEQRDAIENENRR